MLAKSRHDGSQATREPCWVQQTVCLHLLTCLQRGAGVTARQRLRRRQPPRAGVVRPRRRAARVARRERRAADYAQRRGVAARRGVSGSCLRAATGLGSGLGFGEG